MHLCTRRPVILSSCEPRPSCGFLAKHLSILLQRAPVPLQLIYLLATIGVVMDEAHAQVLAVLRVRPCVEHKLMPGIVCPACHAVQLSSYRFQYLKTCQTGVDKVPSAMSALGVANSLSNCQQNSSPDGDTRHASSSFTFALTARKRSISLTHSGAC
jgi:hypothetical protein